jgi:APA family basic amino acid/polyamine antiporter
VLENNSTNSNHSSNQLQPKLGLRAASFLVISVMIGSGVFKKIAPMAQELGTPWLILLCWLIAGIVSLAGALCTAELVSMYPNSGGEYNYFQKIYGRFFSFLYGWASFAVIKTAGISALAYIFAQSLNSLFPLPILDSDFSFLGLHLFENLSIKISAAVLIILLTILNYRGVQFAEKLTTILTYAMLLAIAFFLVVGFGAEQGSLAHLTTAAKGATADLNGWTLMKALFLASLGAFWGYDGWNNIAFIGEEIKNPKRNLPLALGLGTLGVMAVYVMINFVFLYVMPIDFFIELNATPNKIAAVEIAGRLSGTFGMALVACLILVTTLNSTNSSILMSARMLYAMSRDKTFFKQAESVHPKYNTPDKALFIQGIWAILLVFSGSFDQLTDMLVFAAFLFYAATAVGLIYLRVKAPNAERGYKVIGYPIVPILFLLFCVTICIMTLINQPFEAMMGLILIASGLPVYWGLGRKK